MKLELKITQAIDQEVAKYPVGRSQSAIMAALMLAQESNQGYLTEELIGAVADYLKVSRIVAKEVSSFYSMYEHQPVGRYKLELCTNISCQFKNCEKITQHLKKKLGISFGETTPDGRFTLKQVECLGACIEAPVMQIGPEYYGNLTPALTDEILNNLDKI
jgi:NADH-quinone oxidoreductase subunit E